MTSKFRAFQVSLGCYLLVACLCPAYAETAYVTDSLRLGLHQAEDTSDSAFQMLESGQELEIIERNRNYANVVLPDGTEGYVKAAYLVTEKPAKLIVTETQASNEQLRSQLEQLQKDFAEPARVIEGLQQQATEAAASLSAKDTQLAVLTEELDALKERQKGERFLLPLSWVLMALFVCLLSGFLLALWWTDYRSRKRHGGIRIY